MNDTFLDRIEAFIELGKKIEIGLATGEFDALINKQYIENKWFSESNCKFALSGLAKMLAKESCLAFFSKYHSSSQCSKPRQKIAVISAGNIPCAAFHDFFCVLASGNHFIGKLSKQDARLLPFLAEKLTKIAPFLAEKIEFVEKLTNFDKVIATGSNNSGRYFEYYFQKYPMLLRKNRNSVAVLTGNESEQELIELWDDVFTYFGLGCRSVSSLFVPENYDFQAVLTVFEKLTKELSLHHSYMNNVEYYRAIFLLNKIPFFDGTSFLVTENESLSSPIGTLYFRRYFSKEDAFSKLKKHENEIQCVVANEKLMLDSVPFGKTQTPTLFDYPDNEDIFLFCLS